MKIVYIGHKEIKADNIAATGLTWTRGQVHEIADEKKAAMLLEHTLIWRDASGKSDEEVKAILLPEMKAIAPTPRVSIVPEGTSLYYEPIVLPVTEDVFKRLQDKGLIAVFMSNEDIETYSAWKLERDRIENPGPKQGPIKGAKEGLETKKKVA